MMSEESPATEQNNTPELHHVVKLLIGYGIATIVVGSIIGFVVGLIVTRADYPLEEMANPSSMLDTLLPYWNVMVSAVLLGLATVGLIGWGVRRWRLNAKRTLGLQPNRQWSVYGLVAITVVGLGLFLSVAIALLSRQIQLFEPVNTSQITRAFRIDSPLLWAGLGVTLSVVPGVTEELFFRGFTLRGLQGRVRTGTAVLISAILFGVVHLAPGGMLPATILGIFLGYLVVWTGSIYPAIFAHTFNNLVSLGLSAVMMNTYPEMSPMAIAQMRMLPTSVNLALLAVGAGVAIVGVAVIRRLATSRMPEGAPGSAPREASRPAEE